ncbi:MAG: hypothetical protein SV375_02885 [Thermodesulfobacteriota bacterium]|nr:hypothetical protein [Thermodesulfobacteriota bacterium]
MRKYAEIWLDREKAFVVKNTDGKESLNVIKSGVEKHIRLSGGSRSETRYGPQDVSSERKPNERRKHQLQRYYRDVIKAVEEAKKLLIFRPGEAKKELEKEIKKSKHLASLIVAVEPEDKMTENQIIVRVREYSKKFAQ